MQSNRSKWRIREVWLRIEGATVSAILNNRKRESEQDSRASRDVVRERSRFLESEAEDVLEQVRLLLEDDSVAVNRDTALIGEHGVMDSMSLVELCLRLEDRAVVLGFEFDWTSETAMSQGRSMFRTIGSLQDEFDSQQKRAT